MKNLEQEFIDWFHGRGEYCSKLKVKHYIDGEPYFSSQGAECTLRDYIRMKRETDYPKSKKLLLQ